MIHTRVPPSLDSELRVRAERLGLSVSNLVRNILHHTFGLAEDAIKDGAAVARSARGEAVPPNGAGASGAAASPPPASIPLALAPTAAPRVLGWQRFVLGLNALCDRCNGILPKGTEAGIGVLDGAGRRPIACIPCMEELTRDDQPR